MSANAPREPEIVLEVQRPHVYSGIRKIELGASVAAAVTASRQVVGGGDCRAICGWSLRETTGTGSAVIRLHDGGNTNTEVILNANLAANDSIRDWFMPHGILISTGRVYLEVVSGSVEGVLYYV